jgi:hypothetical protein
MTTLPERVTTVIDLAYVDGPGSGKPISARSPGLSIAMTSVACPSPSASIFTNLKAQAARPLPLKEPARKYPVDAYTPKLAAVPNVAARQLPA